MDESRLVLIKNFPNRLFAEQAQQTLEAEGIHSMINAQDFGFPGAAAGGGLDIFSGQGVDLYVDQENAIMAEEIVREIYNGI
jgi:hypothetical protein